MEGQILLTPLWLNVTISVFGAVVNAFMAADGWKERAWIKVTVHLAFVPVFLVMVVRSIQLLGLFR